MKLLHALSPTTRECLTSFMRGEHRQAHEEAEAFLREAEAEGRATELASLAAFSVLSRSCSATCTRRERRSSGHWATISMNATRHAVPVRQ